jgi:hypothetical protein
MEITTNLQLEGMSDKDKSQVVFVINFWNNLLEIPKNSALHC